MSYNPEACGAQCSICPLRGQPFVPPLGPVSTAPKLVVVADAPSFSDLETGSPFAGPGAMRMQDMLTRQRASRNDVLFTFAALCRPAAPDVGGRVRGDIKGYLAWLRKMGKANGVEYPSPFDCCRPRLMRELAAAEAHARQAGFPNGAVVMPVGNYALSSVLGRKKPLSVMKYRGSIITEKAMQEMSERMD